MLLNRMSNAAEGISVAIRQRIGCARERRSSGYRILAELRFPEYRDCSPEESTDSRVQLACRMVIAFIFLPDGECAFRFRLSAGKLS